MGCCSYAHEQFFLLYGDVNPLGGHADSPHLTGCLGKKFSRRGKESLPAIARRPERFFSGSVCVCRLAEEPMNAFATSTFSLSVSPLMLFEGRAVNEFAAFLAALPLLSFAKRGDGHPVLVLPGLFTGDEWTLPLRGYLGSQGYAVQGCGAEAMTCRASDRVVQILRRVSDEYSRKVSIVGWSLGGIYARELASVFPDRVRSVITLGSPFALESSSIEACAEFAQKASAVGHVPTTAIYSRTDGICGWERCVGEENEDFESIEIQGSHCGLGVNPAAIYVIADRLSQPEGKWKRFDRTGWKGFFYATRGGYEARADDKVSHPNPTASAEFVF